ncbi:hypothetical protein DRN97_11940 [Methanosarcinales archaeon]|nr:MAG: hypothetical protein DRN97_11940 [Methanosarcinales archaeon]
MQRKPRKIDFNNEKLKKILVTIYYYGRLTSKQMRKLLKIRGKKYSRLLYRLIYYGIVYIKKIHGIKFIYLTKNGKKLCRKWVRNEHIDPFDLGIKFYLPHDVVEEAVKIANIVNADIEKLERKFVRWIILKNKIIWGRLASTGEISFKKNRKGRFIIPDFEFEKAVLLFIEELKRRNYLREVKK